MSRRLQLVAVVSFLLFPAVFSAPRQQEDDSPRLDLKSIPISDWLNGAENAEIPWNVRVSDAYLRTDQRLEVSYFARIDAKDLNRAGKAHELFFITRISSLEGEWLNEANVVKQKLEEEIPKNVQAQYFQRVVVQPGEYLFWLVLYDRKTGKHNMARRRVRVSELHNDPLPDLYRRMPLVEVPEFDDPEKGDAGIVKSELYLPVKNKHKLQVELISMVSPPEQWTGRARVIRVQNDDTVGALAALSQLDLMDGSISMAGLDLVRREIAFEQQDFRTVDWKKVQAALKKAQSPEVSAKALQGAKTNAAFFREYLNRRIASVASDENPLRIYIVIASPRLFEPGSDLAPLPVEGDCHCRVYYLRFRLNLADVFDEVEKLMKPLRPRTFNLMSPRDLRKAIAEIVEDLGKL